MYRSTVVTGPPAAGKTTYVERHRDRDAVVFDLDQLAAALNPRFARYDDRPADVASLLLGWRDHLVERAAAVLLERNVWLIVTDPQQARIVADRLRAKLVTLADRAVNTSREPSQRDTSEAAGQSDGGEGGSILRSVPRQTA